MSTCPASALTDQECSQTAVTQTRQTNHHGSTHKPVSTCNSKRCRGGAWAARANPGCCCAACHHVMHSIISHTCAPTHEYILYSICITSSSSSHTSISLAGVWGALPAQQLCAASVRVRLRQTHKHALLTPHHHVQPAQHRSHTCRPQAPKQSHPTQKPPESCPSLQGCDPHMQKQTTAEAPTHGETRQAVWLALLRK